MTALVSKASAPLRLMVYDTTDVKFTFNQFRHVLPEGFAEKYGVDIDQADLQIPIGLSHSWFAGGKLYKLLRWVSECKGFSSWEQALSWIGNYKADRQIEQVEFWGHGSPGKSWNNGEPLHRKSVLGGPHEMAIRKIAERMTDNGIIWFRNCSVFAGVPGHEFAKTWSSELDVRIAAHTHLIGPFQSGLHTCGPGEEPKWPTSEGIAEGTPEMPLRLRNSMLWSPNTVFMLSKGVPKNW
jgi:hypothetical protein